MPVFIGSFNVGDKKLGPTAGVRLLTPFLKPWEVEQVTHGITKPLLYVIGFQEVDMSTGALMAGETSKAVPWVEAVAKVLGPDFSLHHKQMMGLLLVVAVSKALNGRCTVEGFRTVGCGLMGKGGNKGGVLCTLHIEDTRMLFINAHLAAERGPDGPRKRNKDIREIFTRASIPPASETLFTLYSKGLRRGAGLFDGVVSQHPEETVTVSSDVLLANEKQIAEEEKAGYYSDDLEDPDFPTLLRGHDLVFVLGDLNYRLHEFEQKPHEIGAQIQKAAMEIDVTRQMGGSVVPQNSPLQRFLAIDQMSWQMAELSKMFQGHKHPGYAAVDESSEFDDGESQGSVSMQVRKSKRGREESSQEGPSEFSGHLETLGIEFYSSSPQQADHASSSLGSAADLSPGLSFTPCPYLYGFAELPVSFPPTYKLYNDKCTPKRPWVYEIDPDAKKPRIPAWCDRILFRVLSPDHAPKLDLREYRAHPGVVFSDHRPVSLVGLIPVRFLDKEAVSRVRVEITGWLKALEEFLSPTISLHFVSPFQSLKTSRYSEAQRRSGLATGGMGSESLDLPTTIGDLVSDGGQQEVGGSVGPDRLVVGKLRFGELKTFSITVSNTHRCVPCLVRVRVSDGLFGPVFNVPTAKLQLNPGESKDVVIECKPSFLPRCPFENVVALLRSYFSRDENKEEKSRFEYHSYESIRALFIQKMLSVGQFEQELLLESLDLLDESRVIRTVQVTIEGCIDNSVAPGGSLDASAAPGASTGSGSESIEPALQDAPKETSPATLLDLSTEEKGGVSAGPIASLPEPSAPQQSPPAPSILEDELFGLFTSEVPGKGVRATEKPADPPVESSGVQQTPASHTSPSHKEDLSAFFSTEESLSGHSDPIGPTKVPPQPAQTGRPAASPPTGGALDDLLTLLPDSVQSPQRSSGESPKSQEIRPNLAGPREAKPQDGNLRENELPLLVFEALRYFQGRIPAGCPREEVKASTEAPTGPQRPLLQDLAVSGVLSQLHAALGTSDAGAADLLCGRAAKLPKEVVALELKACETLLRSALTSSVLGAEVPPAQVAHLQAETSKLLETDRFTLPLGTDSFLEILSRSLPSNTSSVDDILAISIPQNGECDDECNFWAMGYIFSVCDTAHSLLRQLLNYLQTPESQANYPNLLPFIENSMTRLASLRGRALRERAEQTEREMRLLFSTPGSYPVFYALRKDDSSEELTTSPAISPSTSPAAVVEALAEYSASLLDGVIPEHLYWRLTGMVDMVHVLQESDAQSSRSGQDGSPSDPQSCFAAHLGEFVLHEMSPLGRNIFIVVLALFRELLRLFPSAISEPDVVRYLTRYFIRCNERQRRYDVEREFMSRSLRAVPSRRK